MNNIQYTYNQPPMGHGMPPRQMGMPPQMGAPRPNGWRERWMRRFGMNTNMPLDKALTIPQWLTGKSIVFFFVAMFACWMAFGYVPEFELWIISALSAILFFYGSQTISKTWARTREKNFLRNIFIAGLVIRLLWVGYCYFYFNMDHYGHIHGEDADTGWYMDYAKNIAEWFKGTYRGSFVDVMNRNASGFDDTGYPVWLAIGYLIWGDWSDVLIPMIIKCIITAYCAVCIYHIAKRHYGEGVGRMASIFVCLNPNMIYWCGTMFKEAELVFLTCLAIDNFDRVLNSGQKYTFKNLLPGMLSVIAIMFFRSVLGIVTLLAVFAHILMASNRVMSFGKKIIAGFLVVATLGIAMGDRIRTQSEYLLSTARSGHQQENMEWRAERQGGNSFAKYAGAAVFAPLIFTIPFPTFNQAEESQILQVQLSGGSYIKNIFSFFVIMVMLMMLISGEWRRHVFILSYTVGYLVVLVLSEFAQSGRFHMPIWPMLMLFAAYGIQVAKTNGRLKRWFSIVLVLEVVACLAWNWFKLKGRGMV